MSTYEHEQREDVLAVWRCPDGKGGEVVVVRCYQNIAVTR
jgi:hypothetical protein